MKERHDLILSDDTVSGQWKINVRSLEAYRQGSNNTLPIEVTLEELVQGKYGVESVKIQVGEMEIWKLFLRNL